MSEYIVSARKYRPMTFESVVGQEALTTTLRNAVRSGKLAHAYLFCGPRGVGKTTCARIFAKAINCLSPSADGEACGECESCKAFNEGRSMNIIELDAASNNSVENIKSLMEQTRIPPQIGRYKVFIIDEVHMLSSAAFNAFLKTLEEPPAHVIFVLATTEKHKILPTILSRCQIYDFERMTVANTIDHLRKVAEREGYKVEDAALAVIAEKADGGMRDALSIFDQCASFCQGDITYEKVIEDLNVLDEDNYFKLIDLCLDNKVAEVMVLLDSLIGKGFDGGRLIGGLAAHVRNVMMAQDAQTVPLIEASDATRERYKEQAARCKAQFLYSALRLMNECDINYRQSSNKRLLVELTLIETAQLTQADDTPASGRRPRRLKSLFQKIMQAVATANSGAQQVAPDQKAAAMEMSDTPDKTDKADEPDKPENSAPAAAIAAAVAGAVASGSVGGSRPALSIGGRPLGHSFSTVRRLAQPKKMQVIPGTLGEGDPNTKAMKEGGDQQFTQQDVELQWMSMLGRMPQKLSGLATRCKNLNPAITDFPNIELPVDNQLLLDQIEEIRKSITNTFRLYLRNSQINFSTRLVEPEKQERMLSRREQFEQMSQENSAVERLREVFALELA